MTSNCDNGAIIGVKIGAIVFTLGIGLVGSLGALFFGKENMAFRLAVDFAAGEFIGVSLLHLQWSAMKNFEEYVTPKYPIGSIIFVATYLLVLFLHQAKPNSDIRSNHPRRKRGISTRNMHRHGAGGDEQSSQTGETIPETGVLSPALSEVPGEGTALGDQPQARGDSFDRMISVADTLVDPYTGGSMVKNFGYLFSIILAVHSIFGGLVIGLQLTLQGAIINLLAFGVHKGVAAYALGLDLARSSSRKGHRITQCVIFSVSTPVGVAIGMGVVETASPSASGITVAVFAAAAAGAFLYIATVEILRTAQDLPLQLVALFTLLGVAVMSVIFPVIIFPNQSINETFCF